MSEQEKFLDRWSRRKQEASKPDAAPEDAGAKKSVAVPPVPAAEPENPEPEFDVSKLPPVDAITAATDIRAFLSAGVPAQLTRTALRNAWTADPAIRDFIGLSENSWDFNAPDTIPGFGSSVGSSVDLREMAERVFGEPEKADEEAAGETADTQTETSPADEIESGSAEEAAPQDETASSGPAADTVSANAAAPIDRDDGAAQKSEPQQFSATKKRKHGGALPI